MQDHSFVQFCIVRTTYKCFVFIHVGRSTYPDPDPVLKKKAVILKQGGGPTKTKGDVHAKWKQSNSLM